MNDYLEQTIEATRLFENKEISIQDWVGKILGEDYINYFSDEYCRRGERIFSGFIENLQQESIDNIEDKDIVDIILKTKGELEREKVKLSDERRQLKENYRWQARNEQYQERIIDAINRLEPIKIPKIEAKEYEAVDSTAFIGISDVHAGSCYEIRGLNDEIVNKYDFDIMKARFWKLLKDFYYDDVIYDDIVIGFCGDAFENILRMSSLAKLKESVIDTVIEFSEFFAQWIAELQRKTQVPIKVICVGGNHDIVCALDSRPNLEDENLMKIVVKFLQLRLKDCPSIYINKYTEVAVENIRGNSIMLEHGQDKNLQETLEYFSNLFNVDIDEIYAGHLHHQESGTIGITEIGDREFTRLGSICGIDTHAKKIRKAARPSAYVAIYTNDGKTWNRKYYL